jgi:hypothetical protein
VAKKDGKTKWKYLPSPDRKHKKGWDKNEPGFVDGPRGHKIGKCPKNMTVATAEKLLNNGIPFSSERWREDYPQQIYNIHDGQVYRATPTVPGESYHGFPELPGRLEELPRDLKKQLLELAETLGCSAKVNKWLNL